MLNFGQFGTRIIGLLPLTILLHFQSEDRTEAQMHFAASFRVILQVSLQVYGETCFNCHIHQIYFRFLVITLKRFFVLQYVFKIAWARLQHVICIKLILIHKRRKPLKVCYSFSYLVFSKHFEEFQCIFIVVGKIKQHVRKKSEYKSLKWKGQK